MGTPSARRSLARLPWAFRPEGSPLRQSSSAPGGRLRRERGAAMVEFALILPIFVALVLGVISYGYMLSYRQSLGQAASEGARAAAVLPTGLSDAARLSKATNVLNDALVSYGMRCDGAALKHDGAIEGTCSITPKTSCPSDASRWCAIVTVTHAYREHPLVPSFPGLGITLPERLTYTAVVEVS